MQLTVVLADHENHKHDDLVLDFDEQTSVYSMKETISFMWNVYVHQQIWFLEDARQMQIADSERLQQIGLRDTQKLLVKHADIQRWSNYTAYVEKVLKQHENKRANAKLALEEYEQLRENGFFAVYPKFLRIILERHSVLCYWFDEDVDLLCKATEEYFLRLHNEKRKNEDSDFICYFEKREDFDGCATNTLAFVQIHGETSITKYNVKCHHNSTKRSRYCRFPDITEFYCYKLLELIGVSPKCHIIPPVTFDGTKTNAYIATQWDDNFELLKDVMDGDNLCADLVVQLVLLKALLFFVRQQEQNCGRWKGTENAAAIVDFAAETGEYNVYSDIESKLMTTCPDIYWRPNYFDVKNRYDDNSWLIIVKKYVDKWDLVSKIELARQQFDPNNVLLESLEADHKQYRGFEWTPTVHLSEFIETLYENLKNLQKVLGCIV